MRPLGPSLTRHEPLTPAHGLQDRRRQGRPGFQEPLGWPAVTRVVDSESDCWSWQERPHQVSLRQVGPTNDAEENAPAVTVV